MGATNNSEIVRDSAEDLDRLRVLYTQSDVYLLIDLAKWARDVVPYWVGRCELAEQQLRDLRDGCRNEDTPPLSGVNARFRCRV